MTGVIKRGNLQTDRYSGRASRDDEGRGQVMFQQVTMLKVASKPPEARREAWNRLSLTAPRGNQACRHLDLRLPASGTMRQYISVV